MFGYFGGEDQFGEGSVSTHLDNSPEFPKILPNPKYLHHNIIFMIEWCKTGHFGQRTNGYFISLLLEEQLSVFLHYDCTVVSSVQWGYLT